MDLIVYDVSQVATLVVPGVLCPDYYPSVILFLLSFLRHIRAVACRIVKGVWYEGVSVSWPPEKDPVLSRIWGNHIPPGGR